MARRFRPIASRVEFEHDGVSVAAERGEPLAFALIAADRLLLGRSPKLHRPRGPYCLRGACDGCLARVDGTPNVTTCLVPARGGERVETQNVLGTRGVDLLGAADFLFPHGIDHHKLFAGVRGLSSVVQRFARRVAGLGRLPDAPRAPRNARHIECEALVVGAGAAGLAAARELGDRMRVLVVDDGVEPGGSLRALDPQRALDALDAIRRGGGEIASQTTLAGLYREPGDGSGRLRGLAIGPDGALLVDADRVLLCTGAHDATLPFEGNDLPGVISARAALRLWRAGIAVGSRLGLLGDGRFSRAFESLAGTETHAVRLQPDALSRVLGRGRVSAAVLRSGGDEKRERLDAVVVDGPGAPAFELAVQAGGSVRHDASRGYVPDLDATGRAAEAVWCAGAVTGAEGDSASDAVRVARSLVTTR